MLGFHRSAEVQPSEHVAAMCSRERCLLLKFRATRTIVHTCVVVSKRNSSEVRPSAQQPPKSQKRVSSVDGVSVAARLAAGQMTLHVCQQAGTQMLPSAPPNTKRTHICIGSCTKSWNKTQEAG